MLADPRRLVLETRTHSAFWAPVGREHKLRGVLSISSTRLDAFTAQDERLLTLFAQLERAYVQMVMTLANAVDAKDTYTADHAQRMTTRADRRT